MSEENRDSLVEHIGTGRHYNINSKSGYLQMVFADSQEDKDYYNTDIKVYAENLDRMVKASNSHVVIAPGYMVYTQDFDELLKVMRSPARMLRFSIIKSTMQKKHI